MLATILTGLALMTTPITDTLSESRVTASSKLAVPLAQTASLTASIFMDDINQRGLTAPKTLSGIVPNLNMPDYGSSMTSSIYMRGFGSRIDNPVIGLYIDDIPVMDKNAYDVQFLDIRRADFLSGPQGTLFGRNSMTGLLSLTTLAPGDLEGTFAELRYGAANGFLAKASHYSDNWCAALAYNHSDGFYTNEFDGSKDNGNSMSARIRFSKDISPRVRFENILSANLLGEGGYPYRQYIDGKLLPVNYNRRSHYSRQSLVEGAKFDIYLPGLSIGSISSLQLLHDRMDMDQDFTTADMFTLRQSQKQWTLTQEIILRPEKHPEWWDCQSGLFGFYKHNHMEAPVTFRSDGIDALILSNANNGLGMIGYKTDFLEDEFPIYSDFLISTYNLALYHESRFTLGRWLLTAGIRLDYEGNHMSYDSNATINIATIPLERDFAGEDYRQTRTSYKGGIGNNYLEFLPKVSAVYDFPLKDGHDLKVFIYGAKGYKAGGFNTQIFSDILQNRIMTEQYGVHITDQDVTAGNTVYKPESSHNAEAGVKYSREGRNFRLDASSSVFYIDCHDQQITVFPPGKTTGRMMRNAGRSHSCGLEAMMSLAWKGLDINASYGFANAVFDEYDDGNTDYSGKHIQLAPQHTVYVRASYAFALQGKLQDIIIGSDWNARGKIWWNEDNSLYDSLHGSLGADFALKFNKITIFGRFDNLTCTRNPVFYFKSVGNSFFQIEKPFRWHLGLRITL